ncbi:MAG: UDP-N-acetylglucosamine--N-acetylmuramyl-(pentapeptide) pyrophosphoryl-undecaprenol N-acetylglucosamine transferase [Anaerolineae bacterium]
MAPLMIAAGGTGGHVYPALAVAEALRKSTTYELVFVGTRGGGGFERRLVDASSVPFASYHEIWAGPVVGVAPIRALSSLFKMILGLLQSITLLISQRPQAILLTGGWANVPLALAGALLRVPMLIYLPDIEPGTTIRLLSRFVDKIAVTVPDSARYFRDGQTVTTGYPLREAVTSATRAAALAHFGLDPERKTLLVTGGSRGARTINIALGHILPELLVENVQIIHVTGTLDYERTHEQVLELIDHPHYHVFSYLDSAEMGLAFASADIVLGRSGASALGEFTYFGSASILVPYPFAWRYQRVNADWLAEHGAGLHLADEAMAHQLLPTLQSLLRDQARLQQLQACARNLYAGNGSQNIAQEMLALAGGS